VRYAHRPEAGICNRTRMNIVRARISDGFRNVEPAQELMHTSHGNAIQQAVCRIQTLEMSLTGSNSDYIKLINPD